MKRSSKQIEETHAARLARDDIVLRAAKIINPEAFGPEWMRILEDGSAEPVNQSRTRYLQAEAIRIAGEVLKLAAKTPDLAKQLADSEEAGWEDLGVPVKGNPELRKIIDAKYRLPPSIGTT